MTDELQMFLNPTFAGRRDLLWHFWHFHEDEYRYQVTPRMKEEQSCPVREVSHDRDIT